MSSKDSKIINFEDKTEVIARLDDLVSKKLPATISSSAPIDYIFFENDGRKYISVFNHSGVSKDLEKGEYVNPQATVSIDLEIRSGKIKSVELDAKNISVDGNRLSAILDAGCLMLVEYE